jgi:hypothetical protein
VRAGSTHFAFGAGGAIARLASSGTTATPGFDTRDAVSVTAGPLVRAAVALEITPSLRARAALASGVTFPRAVVSFGGRDVADWGRPFALATLGLEWGAL